MSVKILSTYAEDNQIKMVLLTTRFPLSNLESRRERRWKRGGQMSKRGLFSVIGNSYIGSNPDYRGRRQGWQ